MKLEYYTLETLIEEGTTKNVYLASIKDDPKKYLIKKFEREDFEKNEMNYFKNEIVIIQHLNHPNIVNFKEVKKTKKCIFIIYEYLNGGNLRKALEKYMKKFLKPFPEEIIQHFMRQIICVIKYIHEKDIIHDNLNPKNFLLNYDNEEDKDNFNLIKANIKLINFGFSYKLNNSEKRKKAKDIFFIGTICFEMLIGKCAIYSEDLKQLMFKIEDGSYSIPVMSREIVSFINGMIQKDPKKRLTAEQLSRHDFLTKDVKVFHILNFQNVPKNVDSKILDNNKKDSKSVWSFFNPNIEAFLSNIEGNEFVKPINENEKKDL